MFGAVSGVSEGLFKVLGYRMSEVFGFQTFGL